MQLDLGLALTLPLSPRRGNHLLTSRERSLNGEPLQRWKKFTLSQRERAGVRENAGLYCIETAKP